MKNTRLFLGLAIAAVHSVSVACEDGNINATLIVSPVEVVEFNEGPENNASPEELYHLLMTECYRNNNAQACQYLLAFAEKKMIKTQAILYAQLEQKQQTIETQEEIIKTFNESEKRRTERRKRKEAERIIKQVE